MKKNNYWLKRRDQLFNNLDNYTVRTLANYYRDLYNATAADLMALLDEIEKGIVHEGGINEREVLVSDLYKADNWMKMLSDFSANVIKFGGKEIIAVEHSLSEIYEKQKELTTIELGDDKTYSLNLIENIEKAINAVWAPDGKAWSERVWNNTAIMQEELRSGIIAVVARGYSPKKLMGQMQKFLKDDINKGFNRAVRLVRTELSYVQTQACLDKYKEAGVEYYEILAANGACSDCALDYAGQIYRVDEAVVGVNCPPFHPNCRCTTLAVIGGNK